MNIREKIGHRIAEIRKERGLTQQQVADLSGVGRGHLARIEQGKYNVTIDILHKIMSVLDCHIEIK